MQQVPEQKTESQVLSMQKGTNQKVASNPMSNLHLRGSKNGDCRDKNKEKRLS